MLPLLILAGCSLHDVDLGPVRTSLPSPTIIQSNECGQKWNWPLTKVDNSKSFIVINFSKLNTLPYPQKCLHVGGSKCGQLNKSICKGNILVGNTAHMMSAHAPISREPKFASLQFWLGGSKHC